VLNGKVKPFPVLSYTPLHKGVRVSVSKISSIFNLGLVQMNLKN
jgi:hypothetical protein